MSKRRWLAAGGSLLAATIGLFGATAGAGCGALGELPEIACMLNPRPNR